MFILMTLSNWFTDLTVHAPVKYCSSWHQTLLSSPDTSTTKLRVCFGPGAVSFLGRLVVLFCSSPGAYYTPSYLGDSSFSVISFCPFTQVVRFSWHIYWGGLHSLLQWITVSQNSPLWPMHLGWPYLEWLIASLNHASPFATRRQWSLKGSHTYKKLLHSISYLLPPQFMEDIE